jgi:acyl-CoA synthetase (NDP forming)
MDAISRLLTPRSVAVVGASTDPSKTAGRPVAYLQKHGFKGRIFPVNPQAGRIGELACYPDVASLPEAPDAAIVVLGIERAQLAVADLSARGCAAAIVLASGYAEAGEEGARRQQGLLDAAGAMRLLGPNTIGAVNLTDNIVLSPSGALELAEFHAGGIGIVSQSGGILGALLSRATARGIGLSKLIATGNEADLELSDFIEHLAGDRATRVIALYIEALRDPVRFRTACRTAALAGKPVVAFKVGRSEAGARAAVSHTGAMAGTDRMYDALFKQLGVIRARTFSDLLEVPAALATGRTLRDKRVAILTSTGGAGTLISDDLGLGGFDVQPPDAPTAAALRALQAGAECALDRNPIDVTLAGLRPDLLRAAIRALLASSGYDALVVVIGASGLAQPGLVAGAIQECLPESDKPVLAYVSPHAPEIASLLTRGGVPAFAAPESCTAALDAMLRASRLQPSGDAPDPGAPVAVDDLGHGSLDEAQAKQLFARFGIPSPAGRIVTTPDEAQLAAHELGGDVVLKVLSAEIPHKSDVGGVAVGLTPETVGERLLRMGSDVQARTGTPAERFIVQERIGDGIEMILGVQRDTLGTAVLLGAGGLAAELCKDTTLRLLPAGGGLGRDEALSMARELKTWPLLDGFRGRPGADVRALLDAVVAFSCMAAQLGDRLVEAEINPLLVLPQGHGVRAADGVVVLARK